MTPVSESIETEKPAARAWHRNQLLVIVVLTLLTTALLIVAYVVSGAFRREQARRGDDYFARGQAALAASRPDEAVTDFRTALSFAPENTYYRLRLAQALVIANHDKEALAHFRELWEHEPGDGELNLELGRLAAHSGDMPQALRFYHGAIYGLWSKDPEGNRQRAWLELIDLLLQQRADTQAQSELLALSASVPATDISSKLRLASLFMQAGDRFHALALYKDVLKQDRKNQTALVGAGQACLAIGDFKGAATYFREASRHEPLQGGVQSQALVAELASQADPFESGLIAGERRNRAISAFNVVGDRVRACLASKGQPAVPAAGQPASALQTDMAQWDALHKQMTQQNLRQDSDLMYNAMDLVYRAEQDAAATCGDPNGKDMALLLLGRRRAEAGR